MLARKLGSVVVVGAVACGALASGGGAATTSPPRFVKAPVVTYTISKDRRGRYVALGAVIRVNRTVTTKLRRKYVLVASPSLRAGQRVPAALFGGASLGRLGKASKHCYGAEVSQLKRKRSTQRGAIWGLAFTDGKRVVTKVTKVKLAKTTSESVVNAAQKLGCYS